MRYLGFLLLIFPFLAEAAGPRYSHKDRFVSQEFENVYHDIENVAVSDPLSLSSATILNLTTNPGTESNHAATYSQVKNLSTPQRTLVTTAFSTTSNSAQVTNLAASITPSSASSRIKVTVTGNGQIDSATGVNALFSIGRNSVSQTTPARLRSITGFNVVAPVAMTYIDAPATTSAVTYSVLLQNDDGVTTVRFGTGQDQIMILEEIR